MKKVIFSTLFVLTSLTCIGSAYAEVKIGFVDLEKALSSSKAGAAAKQEYEGEVKKISASLEMKKKELDELQEKFEKQRKSLSEDAREKKYEELVGLKKDLERSLQDSKESLRRKEGKLMGELLEKMRMVVKDVAEDEDYTMVFEKGAQAVLFADDDIDITSEVLSRFNKANPK